MTPKPCCACEGHTLDRLLQPTVMALLADGPLHGYALVEQLRDSPLMDGAKPDGTGVNRLLKNLENQHLVSHQMAESDMGPSKHVYELTDRGRECLGQWATTLDRYQKGVAELVKMLGKANK